VTAAPSVNSIRLVNVDLRSAWSMMAGTITLALARPGARRPPHRAASTPTDLRSAARDRGQTVRVVDVDGQQVADFVCFRRPDTLMTITADTCGRHDLLAGSCSEGTNRWRYGVADTPNCRSNFEAALRPFGISLKEVPYSFNIFMDVPIVDGKIGIEGERARHRTATAVEDERRA
jgi:uncharacterized protein YcgI (DUF1989 family)